MRSVKYLVVVIISATSFISFANWAKDKPVIAKNTITQNNGMNNIKDTNSNKMKIKIGPKIFTAKLYNNATVNAFKALLPITANMAELSGNEKHFDLSTNLPTNASNPKTIHAGDLMLWNSNTLVLFYKTFSTSYNYTRLGRIDKVNGLAAAVGSGNVAVTFELE